MSSKRMIGSKVATQLSSFSNFFDSVVKNLQLGPFFPYVNRCKQLKTWL